MPMSCNGGKPHPENQGGIAAVASTNVATSPARSSAMSAMSFEFYWGNVFLLSCLHLITSHIHCKILLKAQSNKG